MESTNGILSGELALPYNGLLLSPGRINEWTGEYRHDGAPRTLHAGRSVQTEIFMTAYLKVASMSPEGDCRWIPVLLSEIEKVIDEWKRRKESIGNLAEVVERCSRHGTFCVISCNSRAWIMPTILGVKLMTEAGKNIIPSRK